MVVSTTPVLEVAGVAVSYLIILKWGFTSRLTAELRKMVDSKTQMGEAETAHMSLIKKMNKKLASQQASQNQSPKDEQNQTDQNEEHKVHENKSEVQQMKVRSDQGMTRKSDDELTPNQRNRKTK